MLQKLADPLAAGQELFDVFPDNSAPYLYLRWAQKAYGSPHIYHLASILVCLAHELDARGFHLTRSFDGSQIPLTLWFMLLGGSGSGKSTIAAATKRYWADAWHQASVHRADPWIEPEGSVQGIVVALQELYDSATDRTSAIFTHTEAAKVFNTREAVGETLCKIYDGETFQANYRRNQTKKGSNPHADRVRNPHVSLLMMSTEEQLVPHFKESHRSGGIFTRFCWIRPKFTASDIWLPADHIGTSDLKDERQGAIDALTRWFAELSQMAAWKPDEKGFRFTETAHEKLRVELFEPFKQAFEEGDSDNMHGVRMRLIEKARVLAAIFAALRGTTIIDQEDLTKAIFLIEIFLAHTQHAASFSSDEIYRYALKLEAVVKSAGEKGIGRRAFYRHLRVNSRTLDQVLATLLDRGNVFESFDRSRAGAYVHITTKTGQDLFKRHEADRISDEANQGRNRRPWIS